LNISANYAFKNSLFLIRFCFLGDAGGGLVLEVDGISKIVGMVSSAKKVIIHGEYKLICDLNNYGVYTDVSKFYYWIRQVILETY
jgi:hypothetical protein